MALAQDLIYLLGNDASNFALIPFMVWIIENKSSWDLLSDGFHLCLSDE